MINRNWLRYFSLYLLIFTGLSGLQAQSATNIPVKVLDIDGYPVESVLIYDPATNVQWITNANGVSVIDRQDVDTLVFQHISYITRKLSWESLTELGFTVTLEAKPFVMPELVLVGRTSERKEDLLHEISTIDQKELLQLQPSSTADAIEKSGSAFVQRSQMGGGSPILRGFEANRILLVVDGIRMNNLIFRSGHLQNSITVGQVGLEQLEIIYGIGSLFYGSDALGGVIHFRSRTPEWKNNENESFAGEAFVRYGTSNEEKTIGTSLEWRGKKWTSVTSMGFSDFGDLKMGESRPESFPQAHGLRNYYVERINGVDSLVRNTDPYLQIGTAYSQWDLFHKTRYRIDPRNAVQFNFQYSGSTNIPRYDQLNDPTRPDTMPRYSEWNYGPQNRLLAALEWQATGKTALYDKMFLILAGQRINETRITRFFRSENRNTQAELVNVYSLSADLEKQINAAREMIIKYGFEGVINDLNSQAEIENITSGEITEENVLTRYPSGSASQTHLGFYGIFSSRITASDVRIESGLRYSVVRSQARYEPGGIIEWPTAYIDGLDNISKALTGSAAVQIPYGKHVRQRFVFGTAFRAPNIDDMAKIRIKGNESQIPNFDLGPERSWQIETTLESTLTSDRTLYKFALTGFYTRLNDAIVQAPLALPNGSNVLIVEGNPFTTFSNINAENAYIAGAGAAFRARGQQWGTDINIQYTYGRSELDGEERPFAHIPPLFGQFSFYYQIPIFTWRVTLPFNGMKSIEDYSPDSSDNPEYGTADGTPAWFTVNFFTECRISNNLSAYLSVENILDRYYRSFSSGVSAPGRHISVSLRAKF